MGAPPGFQQGGPPPAKKGPPIALLVGGGCGLVAVIGVILLIVLVVVGSASADDSDTPSSSSGGSGSPSSSGGGEDVPNAMDGAVYKGIPSTNVEVPVPPGWREDRKSLYTFALAGDGNAVLAFTTVSSVGEFTGRIQHATNVFNITNCNMQDAQRVTIGPNQLRGRLKEGECNFNGVPSTLAVVLVETGRNALPLVIYAVDKRASRLTTVQAQQTIARMRLR